MLNWTIEVIVFLIFLVPICCADILVIRKYIKTQYFYFVYFILFLSCAVVLDILELLAYLFLDSFLYFIRIFFIMFYAFNLILMIDSISRDSIDPVKMVLFAFFVVLAMDITPSDVISMTFPNGDKSFTINSPSITLLSVAQGILTFIFYLYLIKIHMLVPKQMRIYSWLNVMGGFFAGILLVLAIALRLTTIIPGIGIITHSLGALLISIAFSVRPQLAFILPSRVIRLTIIDTLGGIALFNYYWKKPDENEDDVLFSGALQGITEILKETIHRGNIKEIVLEKAVLLVNRSKEYPIACILIATKPTKTLRKTLDLFSNQFYLNFNKYFKNILKVDVFEQASDLVEQIFGFLPKYSLS